MKYVSADDIPAEIFEAEKAIEMQREDLLGKPEAIRAKIAEGRVKKMLQVRRAPARPCAMPLVCFVSLFLMASGDDSIRFGLSDVGGGSACSFAHLLKMPRPCSSSA